MTIEAELDARHKASAAARAQSTHDIVKRLETRVTRFMLNCGLSPFPPPEWLDYGVVMISSPTQPLQSILDVIPATWPGTMPVLVQYRGETVTCVTPAPPVR